MHIFGLMVGFRTVAGKIGLILASPHSIPSSAKTCKKLTTENWLLTTGYFHLVHHYQIHDHFFDFNFNVSRIQTISWLRIFA